MNGPESEPDASFAEWLRELTLQSVDSEDQEVEPGWSTWLREVFDEAGPLPWETVRIAAVSHRLALAREATAAVRADLERVTDLRPVVDVRIMFDDVICISIDDGYTTPSMSAMDRAAGIAEVADYFQEQLGYEIGRMWPDCRIHDFGGDPKVVEGVAVWWCRKGGHAIADVGALTEG